MIGKNIKIKVPDGTEKELKEIRALHFVFEKPDSKIIKYSDGQISGNYLQMMFKFADDQNFVIVSEKPPTQPDTSLVGIQASYQGKSSFFSVDQSDKGATMKIESTSTEDGSDWDPVYKGIASKASEINIANPDQYTLPSGVIIKDDWGGNNERSTWTTTAMTDADKKHLWKVVDSQNKNIAAEFKSQQEAQQFIDYLRKHPDSTPTKLKSGGTVIRRMQTGELPFPADPKAIGFNYEIANFSNKGERQELDISSGEKGDGPYVTGACVFYVKHNERIGRDQYSLKWGFGGDGGEYEHITFLGGRGGDYNRAGWGWEGKHSTYSKPRGPTHINDELDGMRERVEKRGLVVDRAGLEQGFMLVKTRSPNNDATYYDVYVDDMDGQGWKYAFSNTFVDNDDSYEEGRELDCCNQTGREYDDEEMRLEVRFKDQEDLLEFTAANYKKGLPAEYRSPLYATI